MSRFLKFSVYTKNGREKILTAKCNIHQGFPSPELNSLCFFVVSACLFVAQQRTNGSLLQLRDLLSRKKSRCHVPFAIFLSERIGRLRALELTRSQADLNHADMRVCERRN